MSKSNGFTAGQILLPIALIGLVVFISLAFQATQVFRDRGMLHQMKSQQDKPLEDTRRLQAQLTALAQGTLKLAQEGDKNAQAIIDRLKKAGVTVTPPKPEDKAGAGAPTATIPPAPPAHVAMPSKN